MRDSTVLFSELIHDTGTLSISHLDTGHSFIQKIMQYVNNIRHYEHVGVVTLF